jgi:hypothetical protein
MKSPITSDRLQKPLAALRAAGRDGLTPIELNRICQSTRASSDLSELRQHGILIEKEYVGKSVGGRRVFRYRLASILHMEIL